MTTGITEITDMDNREPKVMPIEVESHAIENKPEVEMLSARRIEPENYAEPIPDKPVNEKMAITNIEDIPGVKEIKINPIPNAKEKLTQDGSKTAKVGESLSFSLQNFIRETMNGGMINVLIKKYDLEGIDLEKESERVLAKKSNLSRRQREAVLALNNMRKQQRELLANLSKELMGKNNPSDEDLRNLLDSVEDAATNTEEITKAVVQNIAQRALAAKVTGQETPTDVKEVLEAAMVNYTPGESENTELPKEQETTESNGSIPLTIGE